MKSPSAIAYVRDFLMRMVRGTWMTVLYIGMISVADGIKIISDHHISYANVFVSRISLLIGDVLAIFKRYHGCI